jgi:hypothetical protein
MPANNRSRLSSLPGNMLNEIARRLGPMNRVRLSAVSKSLRKNSKKYLPAPPKRKVVNTARAFLRKFASRNVYNISRRREHWKNWKTMPKNIKRVHLIVTVPEIYGYNPSLPKKFPNSVKFNRNDFMGYMKHAKQNESLNKYINVINNMSRFYGTGTNNNIRKKEAKVGIVPFKTLSYANVLKGH